MSRSMKANLVQHENILEGKKEFVLVGVGSSPELRGQRKYVFKD